MKFRAVLSKGNFIESIFYKTTEKCSNALGVAYISCELNSLEYFSDGTLEKVLITFV